MTVHVFDHNGTKTTYDADTADSVGHLLWVKTGDTVVAIYAPGKWINADIEAAE